MDTIESNLTKVPVDERDEERVQKFRGVDFRHPGIVYGTAVGLFLGPLAHHALASVDCKNFGTEGRVEFTFRRGEYEPNHTYRFVPISSITKGDRAPAQLTAQFEDIKKIDLRLLGVNYDIADYTQFYASIRSEIPKAKRELGLGWSSMSEMTPQDLIRTSAWISSRIPSSDDIIETLEDGRRNPTYNPTLRATVDRQPIDQLLFGGIGVCRHFSAAFKVTARAIKEITQSPALNFVHVGELSSIYDNHATNVIFELTQEDGRPVVLVSFIDALIEYESKRGKMTTKYLDDLMSSHQKLEPLHLDYLSVLYSPSEQREFLACLLRYVERGGAFNMGILGQIIKSYRNEKVKLLKDGNIEELEQVSREERAYYQSLLPRVLQGMQRGAGERVYRIFSLQVLGTMYFILEDSEGLRTSRKELYELLDDRELEDKIRIGDELADQLGKGGDSSGAFAIYEELLGVYTSFARVKGYRYVKRILDGGQVTELEPFLSREHLEQYIIFKKGEWESRQKAE